MDRREAGEELYRQKFAQFGLAEKFEFLRRDWSADHGKRVYVRCKSCGETFLTYGVADVFKNRSPHLCCIKCGAASDGGDVWARSPKCAEAMDYYVQGHSIKETAELFGVPEYQVYGIAAKRGLSNGKDGLRSANEKRTEQSKDDLIKYLSDRGFNAVVIPSGALKDCCILIRCQSCGEEMVRTYNFLRKGNVICRACEKRKTAERQEVKRKTEKAKAEARRFTKEILRLWYPPVDARREALLNQTGVCEICGKPYTVRDYVTSCGMKYARNNGVCSLECRNEKLQSIRREAHKGRQDSHRHRAQRYGCEYDHSVNLGKLIERDGLRCAICGEMCDPNDHSWSKYSGPMYPSIDHIIPMSKGGGHTWGNVQVAHIICNAEKGDKFEEVDA